ncbi:MAG: response regulator [Candidatus Binataceae bacterium]
MARILITDDDAPMRAIMAEALKHYGHTVEEATTAREALQKHREHPADLIVTDLVMREMDGTELLRRIQATSPQTPVIGVSGDRHSTIYLNMAKMLGAARILEKPFSPQEFADTVEHVLANPTMPNSTAGGPTRPTLHSVDGH